MNCRRPLLFIIPIGILLASQLEAQWTNDIDVNTPISIGTGQRYVEEIVSDGVGGAYIVWDDYGYTQYGPVQVYVQRISSTGYIVWQEDGVSVSLTPQTQVIPEMCIDGKGGVIIAWIDERQSNSDIYAQRFNANGARLWGNNGVAISIESNTQYLREISPDGNGGALIVWKDFRYGEGDIFAQKVDSGGIVQWQSGGAPVCVLPGEHGGPDIVSDGAGGAFVVWDDNRPGGIYMQRLDPTGTPLWTLNGKRICLYASCGGGVPKIQSDGSTGAIVLWKNVGIHGQRISSSGNILWGSGGVLVTPDAGYTFDMATDASGGAIICTGIESAYARTDIYAQRIASDGSLPWGSVSVAICTTRTSDLSHPRLAPDGEGGAIITWGDLRNDSIDVYAQRVDSLGNPLWSANGIAVSTASRDQKWPFVLSDGTGGGIFTWHVDNRHNLVPNTSFYEVYAQKIDRYGFPGVVNPSINAIFDSPADQGGWVDLLWTASYLDRDSAREVYGYAVYRWDDSLEVWIWLDHISATSQLNYSIQVPTQGDSTKNGVTYEKFIVQALDDDSSKLWTSDADSGYSVDNLAPAGVTSLSATPLPDSSVALTWPPNIADSDIRSYIIFREDSTNVQLPAIILNSGLDTFFIDSTYQPGTHSVYFVVVEDIHDNRSDPSPRQIVNLQNVYSYRISSASWRLLSIPIISTVVQKDSIFPGTIGYDAFRYQGAYQAVDSLYPGWGFWLKFPSPDSITIYGHNRSLDTIPVNAGWNLIGSLSHPLPVSRIESEPAGMVGSQFYTYINTGYVHSDTLWPGYGYWIKMSGEGKLILSTTVGETITEKKNLHIRPIVENPPSPPHASGNQIGLNHHGPYSFRLEQNTPNPFNPSTDITYSIPFDGFVAITVYSVLGEEVSSLVREHKIMGRYTVRWEAPGVPSGIYFYRLTMGTRTETGKMLLLR